MISTTRRWLRRNRTNFAIGLGVLGAGYVAGQYVINKLSEARERMSIDRIARENLRRRFQQNQEDCTFTVLALLPTAAENILEALPVENITHELQRQKAERLGRSAGALDAAPSGLSSGTPSVTDEDGRSLSSFQAESFMHTSQMAASGSSNDEPGSQRPKQTKTQLWSELKISSITRSFALIYTLSLLTLLTRLQLNLLGRRSYLSSVVSLATQPPNDTTISLENHDDDRDEQSYGNDFETNRRFLTFSWWLLHRGWKDVMEKVEVAVKEIFGPLNPREDISLEQLSSLVVDVRKKVEGATPEDRKNQKWLSYLLPPQDQEELVLQESGMSATPPSTSSSPSPISEATPPSPPVTSTPAPLRCLLDETSDLIDSPTFTHILTLLLDTTFSYLTDQKLRSQAFKLPPPIPDPISVDPNLRIQEILDPAVPPTDLVNAIDDPTQAKTKLANILAVMTRQAHSIGSGVSNEYVQATEGVRELEAFAAVIYSSNFEFEAEGSDGVHYRKDTSDEGKGKETAEGVEEGGMARVVEQSEGVIGATKGLFESVWGRVTGRSQGPMTG